MEGQIREYVQHRSVSSALDFRADQIMLVHTIVSCFLTLTSCKMQAVEDVVVVEGKQAEMMSLLQQVGIFVKLSPMLF